MTDQKEETFSFESDIKKLKILLPYWVNHNQQHIQDNEKWIKKAEELGFSEVVNELKKSVEISKKANEHIELAQKNLEKGRPSERKKNRSQPQKVRSEKQWEPKKFGFKQIGIIRSPYTESAPYQPLDEDEGDFRIIVDPQHVHGLQRLESFRYIYVLYYIDRIKKEFLPLVNPPWTGDMEVGVFASRAPARPNPIGLSIVTLKKIINNEIFTSGLDVFDGTPLLDVKPYIKDLDSKPDANYGWVEELDDFDHLLLHIKGIPHDY